MARKFIKRFLPDPKKIQRSRYLKFFGKWLKDPNLWLLNRRSVASACSVGLFIAYLPIPGHMLYATLVAILLRCNLPITLAVSWVLNPLTILPMFGFAFTIGATILGISLQDLNFHSIEVFKEMWQPFILGCFICGTFLSVTSNIGVRLFWRYSVVKSWQRRQKKREAKQTKLLIEEI